MVYVEFFYNKASLGYKQGYYKNKDDFMMIMIYDIQS